MVLPVSSLSVALQGFADFLDSQFGQEVVISLDTPQKAAEQAKGANTSVLNIFAYRLQPSGFHAEAGFQDPLFIRANILLTCFPAGQGNPPADTDLRVVGHAMSVLHSVPTIPVILPGAVPVNAPVDDFRRRNPIIYQIQAILQAPGMEELNHIWTTQGGDLAYRLSAAYELALIPVEPLSQRPPVAPMTAAIIDVAPSSKFEPNLDGSIPYGAEPMGLALASLTQDKPPPVNPPPVRWTPIQMFPKGAALSNSGTVSAGDAQVDVAVAGPLGARIALTVKWTRNGGASDTQAAQDFTLGAQRVDDPASHVQLQLTNAAAGDTALILAVPADQNGAPIVDAPPGNTLTLTVGA